MRRAWCDNDVLLGTLRLARSANPLKTCWYTSPYAETTELCTLTVSSKQTADGRREGGGEAIEVLASSCALASEDVFPEGHAMIAR